MVILYAHARSDRQPHPPAGGPGSARPSREELQLDIPSRTILRTAENQARDDWSYPNFRTSTCIGGNYFVSWGWKLPGTAWGFLSVPMTWVLKVRRHRRAVLHQGRAQP